jgi:hypothetical protein
MYVRFSEKDGNEQEIFILTSESLYPPGAKILEAMFFFFQGQVDVAGA